MMSVTPSLANNGQQHGAIAPNNAYPHDVTSPIPKKKKRRREDQTEVAADGGDDISERKKRKRRHERVNAEEHVIDPALSNPIPTGTPVKPPKKPKKKDKGKRDVTQQSTPESVSTPHSSPQTSATALISAIVAAATGVPDTPDHIQAPSQSQFQPHMIPHPSQQHFMQYPFMQSGYPVPPYIPQNPMQSPTLFPTSMGLPFSELAFGSNEDVLRALQALDMSKITNVLKTLGEAAAAANGQPLIEEQLTALGQVPVGSDAILNFASKEPVASTRHRRTLDMNLPGTEHHTRADHAHLLANKWLNAGKLAELVRNEGLVYKKGKFSAIEEQQLKSAIDGYRSSKQLTEDQMNDLIFPKVEKNKDNAFWSEITAAVPQRPIIAVYHHVRRTYHPKGRQGKWQPHEDAALKQAVTDLGQQWEKVSVRVGRMSSDCRDRYRNHIINRDIRVTGPWTKEEEDELTRIVTDMTIKKGRDADGDVFWGRVSELMGGKRGRQQCRIKWTDALSKTVKNEGQKPRWSQQDAFILVHKVDSLNVRDDTEIDWKTIADPQWNLWSAHTLQRRWLTMKRGVKGFEDMTHQEIMDILRVKKAQLPVPPPVSSRKRKERKVVSAAAITECDALNEGAIAEPGSSAGPGTAGVHIDDSDESTDSDE